MSKTVGLMGLMLLSMSCCGARQGEVAPRAKPEAQSRTPSEETRKQTPRAAKEEAARDKTHETWRFNYSPGNTEFDLSPDGTALAYVMDRGLMGPYAGRPHSALWVKLRSSGEFIRLPGDARAFPPGPRWSPDGSKLAYLATDESAKDGELHLHIWSRSGRRDQVFASRVAATHIAFPYNLEWSPDGGTVYYVAGSGSAAPPTAIPAATAEPFYVETMRILHSDPAHGGVTVLEWPPAREEERGKRLVSELAAPVDVVAADVKGGTLSPVLTGVRVREIHLAPNGRALLVVVSAGREPGKTNQQYVDLYALSTAKGVHPVDLSRLRPLVRSVKVWAGRVATWSPTSDRVAYAEEGPLSAGDLFVVDIARGEARNLTATLELPEDLRDVAWSKSSVEKAGDFRGKFGDYYSMPVWSRNGQTLYLVRAGESVPSDRAGMRGELWAIAAATGKAKQLVTDASLSVTSVPQRQGTAWSASGSDALVLPVRFIDDNTSGFVRLEPGSGVVKVLARFRGKATRDPSLFHDPPDLSFAAQGDHLAFVNERSDLAPELFTFDLKSGAITQETAVNLAPANKDVGEVRRVSWVTPAGRTLGALLHLPPAKYRPPAPAKLPLVMLVYPGNTWMLPSLMEENYAGGPIWPAFGGLDDLLLKAGYAILCPDLPFKGEGHASEEITANAVAALDAVKATGLVDTERAGVMGISAGGYAVNVIITHTTRFKAAVASAGSSDWIGEYLDPSQEALGLLGDGGDRPRFGGTPWQVPERYIADSPIFHVQNVTTPLLLIHGKHDLPRQAYAMYASLKRFNKTVTCVLYDNNGHLVTHPEMPPRVMRWFDRYLK